MVSTPGFVFSSGGFFVPLKKISLLFWSFNFLFYFCDTKFNAYENN